MEIISSSPAVTSEMRNITAADLLVKKTSKLYRRGQTMVLVTRLLFSIFFAKIHQKLRVNFLGIDGTSLSIYPNYNELVFQIFPKLEYDILKEFKKLTPQDHRYELLERRLKSDNELNENRIKSSFGTPVKYGETVQLLHDLTQGFLRVSQEKDKKLNLFRLKLTREGMDEVHMTILPLMSLKKEGQIVSYSDKFTLTNKKFQMSLIIPKHHSKEAANKLNKTSFADLKKFSVTGEQINLEDLPLMQDLPICEQNDMFMIENAHSTNLSTRFQRKIGKDISADFSNAFSFRPINYSRQRDRKDLHYGDFIQIKSKGLTQFSQGEITSETNYSGFGPGVKYRIITNQDFKDIISFDSIFQIVPKSFQDFGLPLSFVEGHGCPVVFRHFLSGRLLTAVENADGSVLPRLSEEFSEFCVRWTMQPENQQTIQNFKNVLQKKEQKELAPNQKSNLNLNKKKTAWQEASESETDEDDLVLEPLADIISVKFFEMYSLRLVREASADEDPNLLTTNLLQIQDQKGRTLKIFSKDSEIFTGDEINMKQCAYFTYFYYQTSVKDIRTMNVEFSSDGSEDNFYLDHVSMETINRVVHYVSTITPLLKVFNASKFDIDLFYEGDVALKKLTELMKMSYDGSRQLEKGVYSKQVQNSFRELGILDLCIKYIYMFVIYDLGEYKEDMELFLNSLIRLMDTTCLQNDLNCYYLFQWYNLFSGMIMGRVNPERDGPCKVDVDVLLSTIFDQTEFNASVIDTLEPLLATHNFQKYDIKALNLLFSLVKSPLNKKRDLSMLEMILSKILSHTNFNKVFKPFRQDGNHIYIEIEANLKVKIDKDLQKQIQKISYITRNIQLATEMCKDYSSLFIPQYERFLPESLCLKMITSDDIATSLRSSLIEFYIQSYLSAKCQGIPIQQLPEIFKIREEDYDESLTPFDEQIRTRSVREMSLEGTKMNVKDYIFKYLEDPENYIKLQPEFLESLINLLIFLLKRGFLVIEEIAEIRLAIFSFIKYFISIDHKHKFTNIAEILLTQQSRAADNLETQTSQVNFKQVEVGSEDSRQITGKRLFFVSKMIKALHHIEQTIFDLRFEYLISEKESRDFFDQRGLKQDLPQEEKNAILLEIKDKKEDYMLLLSKEIAPPDNHYAFMFVDIMTITDLDIAKQSLDILIELYDVRAQFMRQIPFLQVLTSDGIMDKEYIRMVMFQKKLYQEESKLIAVRDPSNNPKQISEIFQQINTFLTELIGDISMKVNNTLAQVSLAKGLLLKHMIRAELPNNDEQGTEGYFLNLFNEITLNLDKIDLKQKLFKNVGIIRQIFKIIELCGSEYMQFAEKHMMTKKGQYFSDEVIFGTSNSGEKKPFLQLDILMKCLIILIYCSLKNNDLQDYLRGLLNQKIFSYCDVIFETNSSILKYFFTLLQMIYSENLGLLVQVSQKDSWLLNAIAFKFQNYLKDDLASSYYCLQAIFKFAEFKQLGLFQNQIFISDVMRLQTLTASSFDFTNFVKDRLMDLLQEVDYQQEFNYDPVQKHFPYVESKDLKICRLPQEIVVTSLFLKNISDLSENHAPGQMHTQNKIYLSLEQALTILKSRNDFWSLKSYVLKYLCIFYLADEIEEAEWDILALIAQEEAQKITDVVDMLLRYEAQDEKVIFIDKSPLLSSVIFLHNTNEKFDQIYSEEYSESVSRYLLDGVIPFLEKFINMLPNTGSKNEREIMSEIQKKLKDQGSGSRMNAFAIFKRDYMHHIKQNGADFAEKSSDNGNLIAKSKIERNELMKTQIYIRLEQISTKIQSETGGVPLDTNKDISNNTSLKDISNCLYYNYWETVNESDREIGDAKYVHHDLNANFLPEEFYMRLRQEDTTLLIDYLLGLKIASLDKFRSLMKVLIKIIGSPFGNLLKNRNKSENSSGKRKTLSLMLHQENKSNNDVANFGNALSVESESLMSNQKNIMNALDILRSLLKQGQEQEIEGILSEIIELDVIPIVSRAIIDHQGRPDLCNEYIKLAGDILQEQDTDIQDAFLNFIKNDPENQFMLAYEHHLKSEFLRFKNSESIKKDLSQVGLIAEKSKNYSKGKTQKSSKTTGFKAEANDILMVGRETILRVEALVSSIETLRLLCEGHHEGLQEFLRVQSDGGIRRSNSVNFIVAITDMLINYKQLISDSNIELGNKIFEFFIEIIQGPCFENQVEICRTKLLETVEDILIEVATVKNPSKSKIASEDESSTLKSLSETVKSNLIQNMINFMMSLVEGNDDPMIITKLSIHVNQEVLLRRMRFIYRLFKDDIEKLSFGALDLIKLPINLKTGLFKSSTTKEGGGLTSTMSNSQNEQSSDYKVMAENKRDYHQMIMEGIQISILIQTICFLDDNFTKRYEDLVKELVVQNNQKSLPKVITYFKDRTASLEVVNNAKDLQKIYFPLHPMSNFLSDYSKKNFDENVNRESANDKIKDLLTNYTDLHEEMVHFQKLNSLGIPVNLTYFEYLKTISLIIAIVANVMLIATEETRDQQFGNSSFDTVIKVLGFIMMVIYLLIGGLWLLFNSTVDLKKTHRKLLPRLQRIQKIDNHITRSLKMFGYFKSFAMTMLLDTYLFGLALNITFALLAVFYSKIFLSFLLLDFIPRSELLKDIIKSVRQSLGDFFITSILGIALMFIYTSMAHFSKLRTTMKWDNDPEDFEMCSNYAHCFLTMMGFGLRSGGGIGSKMFYPYYQEDRSGYITRFINDFSFFALVSTIYLNILFGILIDSFSELREQKDRINFDRKFNCFICNISKTEFLKEGISFKDHRHKEHNLWVYLYYLAYLKSKDASDMSGVESYIFDKYTNEDISWFPMGRAISLKEAQERDAEKNEEEELTSKLVKFLERFENGNDLAKLMNSDAKHE